MKSLGTIVRGALFLCLMVFLVPLLWIHDQLCQWEYDAECRREGR